MHNKKKQAWMLEDGTNFHFAFCCLFIDLNFKNTENFTINLISKKKIRKKEMKEF